jgi:hypothetical protein
MTSAHPFHPHPQQPVSKSTHHSNDPVIHPLHAQYRSPLPPLAHLASTRVSLTATMFVRSSGQVRVLKDLVIGRYLHSYHCNNYHNLDFNDVYQKCEHSQCYEIIVPRASAYDRNSSLPCNLLWLLRPEHEHSLQSWQGFLQKCRLLKPLVAAWSSTLLACALFSNGRFVR